METDVEYYSRLLLEEQREAQSALSAEAAELHLQRASLYEAQLRSMIQTSRDRR